MKNGVVLIIFLVPLILSFPIIDSEYDGPIELDSGISELRDFHLNATYKRAVIDGMYGSKEQQEDFASCVNATELQIISFAGGAEGMAKKMADDNFTFYDNITDFVQLGKSCVNLFYPLYTKCITNEGSLLDQWWSKVNSTDFNWTTRVHSLNKSHPELTKWAKISAQLTDKQVFYTEDSGRAAGATFYFFASATSLNISLFAISLLFFVLL